MKIIIKALTEKGKQAINELVKTKLTLRFTTKTFIERLTEKPLVIQLKNKMWDKVTKDILNKGTYTRDMFLFAPKKMLTDLGATETDFNMECV